MVKPALAQVELGIPHEQAEAGDYVAVPVINVSEIPDINIFQFRIAYNGQVLSFDDVQNINSKLGNAMFSVSEGDESSAFTLNGLNMTASSIPEGSVLFELVFHFCHDALACAQNGSMSQLDFVQDDTYLVFWDSENYQDVFYDIAFDNGSVYAGTPMHFVEVQLIGNGAVAINDSPYNEPLVLPAGSPVKLEAFPDADWEFLHWDVNGQYIKEDNPWEFTLEQNKEIIAYFLGDEVFVVSFLVENQDQELIYDAVLTFDGVENEPGHYVVHDVENGTYHYEVSKPCFMTVEGTVVVDNNDLDVQITMEEMPGDANGDGLVNSLDVLAVFAYFMGDIPDVFCHDNADVNQDQRINCLDAILMAHMFMKGD